MIGHLETEEATKNALVMPFIAALGYDVFNPQEVVPELTADVGVKKGEKVDYAIKQDGEVIILIECKAAGANLSEANMSQLFRYFTVTKARIAILTNGIHYRLYSDLEEPNKMDARPFLELDLLDIRDHHVNEVKRLAKGSFDLDRMLNAASELKYLRELRRVLAEQFESPDPELVRFLYLKVNPEGRFIASVREQFGPLVAKALQQFISERVSGRLRTALAQEDVVTGRKQDEPSDESNIEDEEERDPGIETTADEIEAFHMVKAIVREVVAPERIAHRDTKSYMGILLDDNNRKPICRLRFNAASQYYLGTFDADKNETRHPIDTLNDIYQYADHLRQTAAGYDS
ncbi:type I restriction endonuclease [Rubrivirga sp.]|uniref:type I restriction endonuclease n=1 Tax=Rubrivirga sp. TaxID=1885344 RepID=UPI003C766A4C